MASAGVAPWVVSMQTRQGGASACRPNPPSCAFLLHRAPSGLSQAAPPSARFISILSLPRSRIPPNVVAIHAQDPDFYKIPYVEGMPVGKRLKLWNLPQNCKHSELLEWFAGVDVKVDSLEFTDDPVLNAQGIGGFVELATKQDACIAIVRLDGYKFRGNYIRLDFAEKRPHSRNYGSRRNRPNRSSSSSGSQGNFATPSHSSVTDMVPSYDGATSANAQSTLRYEAANASVVHTPSGYGSSTQSSANAPSTPRYEEAANSIVAHTASGYGSTASARLESSNEAANFSTVQASSNHGSSTESSEFHLNGTGNSQSIPSNPDYGNVQSPAGNAQPPAGYGSTLPSAGYRAGNSQGVPSNPGYGNVQIPAGSAQSRAGYGSTLPSAGYGATQFPPGHGSAPSSSIFGGSSSTSNPPPPSNYQSAAPRYGNTPESGDEVNKTSDYHPLPSVAGYGSSQSPPSYGNSAILGSSSQQKNDATFGSPQQPLSQSGTELNRQSATAPSSPSYNNRSGAPLHRNRKTQPLYSDGTVTGKSFKSGSGWAAQGTANYGLQSSPPHQSLDSQSISSYGNAGMESNTTSTQSSFISSQIPPVSSSSRSSPGSVSIPAQPSYGEEAQPSARSSTTQAAPSSYNGTKKSPAVIGGHAPMHSPGALSLSYAPVEPYEDAFENYGVPDAAVLEPWLHNTSFRSGPMFGSPQPSSLNRLFVGNLAVSIDDAALHELFSKFGTVLEARVLRDQESRRSRGFAVVAMASVDEMKAASKALDGWRVESRALRVDAVTFKH